jgi:hypothetical protein
MYTRVEITAPDDQNGAGNNDKQKPIIKLIGEVGGIFKFRDPTRNRVTRSRPIVRVFTLGSFFS